MSLHKLQDTTRTIFILSIKQF